MEGGLGLRYAAPAHGWEHGDEKDTGSHTDEERHEGRAHRRWIEPKQQVVDAINREAE